MTLEDRIALAVQAVGAKFQRAYAYIGVLGSLNTEIKTDIVSAINNLLTLEGTIIIDKDGRIAALKNDLINGAASEYDTLQELYAAILANTSGLTSVLNDVANLVRYDAAQTLTDGQKTTARNNIGAVRTGSLGVIDRDYRAFFLDRIYVRTETFSTPGTYSFTPSLGLNTVKITVVGAGGMYGCSIARGCGGGGGGGAWVKDYNYSISNQSPITVIVGSAGLYSDCNNGPGESGTFSQFGSIRMEGGGGGNGIWKCYPGNGGSCNNVQGAHNGGNGNQWTRNGGSSYGSSYGGQYGNGNVGASGNGLVIVSWGGVI